ncbi:Solute carrier family 40 (iron-regulated transporter) protein [Lasiodiplodia theobromae]|uniref:Solute carrier family 40 (iron-regulated transporter) protein n=1 Tax=Lasiodiplodia theobromae TaxID=45133 RepID=UPI0015C35A86|nr:Solute carrier family 40 (iron-regulated transporter) protein [Lasiodiplodia theobromae]KAF4539692.1 Solute carrier family 40 (iron-regulated transporter) protein [Lasiodiplodia theobromae]
MRLRLSIRRHNLPAADLLWAVPDDRAHDAFTVAQLLENLNDIIPLESPHWGLEDYAVEINNYEALHFQKVKDIFKDEDQVCIRYLTQPELRARHIAGRDQINANGQHLIDGIPFGKSYFASRKPYRPSINIPPLKNPIADEDAFPALLENAPQLQDHNDEDEDDEDFDVEQPTPKRRRLDSVKSDKSDKSVHFQEDDGMLALLSDLDDTEEEYQVASSDNVSTSSIADSLSDVSSRAASNTKMADAALVDNSSVSSSDSDSSSDDSDSSSDVSSSDDSSSDSDLSDANSSSDSSDSDSSSSDEDDSASSSEPDEISSKVPATSAQKGAGNQNGSPKPTGAPFQGLERTKARNRRRRLGRLHKKLKELHGSHVPSEQTEKELERLEADRLKEKKEAFLKMLNTFTPETTTPEKNVLADPVSTFTDAKTAEGEAVDLDVQGGLLDKSGKENHDYEAQKSAVNSTPNSTSKPTQEITSEIADTPAPKRKRIDVGSFRRLTMGSLGLRTPKNKEEEQKLRDKIAANANGRGKKTPDAKSSVQAEDDEPEDLQDPDAWKSRIELKAFEVSDENVQQLSAPPFPFKQRWDQQQHYFNEYDQEYETKKKNKKKRKRNNQTYDEQDQYYEPEGNEEWAILNYDEVDAAQSQLLQETQDAQSMTEVSEKRQRSSEGTSAGDDLPPLPSDITTLQKLAPADIHTGSVVVYKEMEVSELTGWQPVISEYRRARVLEVDEDAAYLQLAAPDVPRKQAAMRAGNKGGKLESKTFVITEEEDEEEDPSKRWVEFTNMADLLLLQAASGDEAKALADVHMADQNGEGSASSETDAHATGTKEDNADEGTTD